jgi:diguanylate cyclase (GGDEF)-like protein
MLLINNYTPPPGFDPTVRPWYKAAIKSFPNISQGIPYQEIKTKEWLVSISKALIDDKNHITGVITIDTSLNKILKKIDEKKIFNIFNFIIRDDGLIIVCHNKLSLNKNFFEKNKINKNIFNNSNGFFEYGNHEDKIAYFNKIEDLGWIVITEIDKKEILIPIIKNFFFTYVIISLILIIFVFFMTVFITKDIINSLYNLHKNIQFIINNEQFKRMNSSFVEINEIYENILSLTKNALYKKNQELKKLNKKLEEMAIKDKLTGLYNRYKFNEELLNEIKRYKRYKIPFCLIMFDTDHFKKINDTFGHDVGDKVLKEIAEITKDTIRDTDLAARWGGEEFMILCSNTKLEEGINIAERLRKTISNHDFGINRRVTISLGIVEYNDEKMEMKDILKIVNEKLYQAKNSERNKVIY